ncbi:MAG: hypothetical protein IJ409_01510 [Lachnospiraceae bacterium]|nr:hypothetical protein [Lachnospiraceae bacterium]
MFFSGKKIVYLNCYEEEEKGDAAGFARFSKEKGKCRIQICIRKVKQWEDGSYRVVFEGIHKAFALGEILIRQGEGTFDCLLPFKNGYLCFGKEEETPDNLFGIAVCGKPEKVIRGRWQEAKYRKELKHVSMIEAQTEEKTKEQTTEKKVKERTTEKAEEKTGKKMETKESVPEIAKAEKGLFKMQQEWVEDYAEDKWKQLLKVYPKVHPFGDDRGYISIEPKDFIILQSSYQKLVNNSFLLHGFYNYRHIILGPCSELGKENSYYLGVPGTFYEREKMVAVMFGFEGFECSGPVEIGKFGYYMRSVEL